MEYVVGVDVGGTCTDCVVLDSTGSITISKTFSTPPNFSDGVLDAVRLAALEMGLDTKGLLEDTRLFLHATTIAENAIFDGDLAQAGLITTKGFEATLALMRGGYAEWAGRTEEEIKNVPYVYKPAPLIPIALTRGVNERVDVHGDVLVAADREEIVAAAKSLIDAGAQAIGVSFLWGFANTANERVAAEAIREVDPSLFVTLSHEVAPVIGEFERSQTVALNIRLGPAVSRYLQHLEDELRGDGYTGSMLVMQAYGGLLTAELAKSRPVGMIESGPVSGLVGSKALGDVLDYPNIIGIDMGGTTFKAGVISQGAIDYAREPMVAQYHYSSPKINMESIGLAGGSIISLDPVTGAPRVGPRSAGSRPGPACYGRGGEEPTITDVDAILGYLNADYFLGGREPLKIEESRRVFTERIAEPLGLETVEAAGEVYRMANSMIYDMLHKLTVERGLDPRNYFLFSSGGTAGMHVGAFAPSLNVKGVVIPSSASVHSALGLVTSDVAHEEQVTHVLRPPSTEEVNELLGRLVGGVRAKLRTDGFADEDMTFTRSIELRYRRQVHVVTTPVEGPDVLTDDDVEAVVSRFEGLYEDRFGLGSGYREAGIEMVNFRVRGVGSLGKPELSLHELGDTDASAACVDHREAYFAGPRQVSVVPCFDFDRLAPGNRIEGPAIIWTPITTVVVNPDQVATCDQFKNIAISW
jgi:N-methylhydantoinase A